MTANGASTSRVSTGSQGHGAVFPTGKGNKARKVVDSWTVWGPSVCSISPPMELVALVLMQSFKRCGESVSWPPPPAIPSRSSRHRLIPEG